MQTLQAKNHLSEPVRRRQRALVEHNSHCHLHETNTFRSSIARRANTDPRQYLPYTTTSAEGPNDRAPRPFF